MVLSKDSFHGLREGCASIKCYTAPRNSTFRQLCCIAALDQYGCITVCARPWEPNSRHKKITATAWNCCHSWAFCRRHRHDTRWQRVVTVSCMVPIVLSLNN